MSNTQASVTSLTTKPLRSRRLVRPLVVLRPLSWSDSRKSTHDPLNAGAKPKRSPVIAAVSLITRSIVWTQLLISVFGITIFSVGLLLTFRIG
jgi:hypothetical protein